MNSSIDRVVLIVPPSGYTPASGWNDIAAAPLEGATIAATLLSDSGIHVEAHDLRHGSDAQDVLLSELRSSDCLCLAAQPHGYSHLKIIANIAREETQCGPIIAGGPLATSAYRVLLECTGIDYCVIGECENALVPLLTSITRGDAPPPGVAWRDSDNEIRYFPEKRINQECVNKQPTPDFAIWKSKTISSRIKRFPKTLCYSTVRGCPNNCTFCANLLGHKVTLVERQKISMDFNAMQKGGAKFLYFNDPTFNVHERHSYLVCSLAADYGFHWTCTIRASRLSKELVRTMRNSGCDAVFLGIETLDQSILDMHHKGINVDDIHEAVSSCLKENLRVIGFFMLDLPGETVGSLNRTLEFARNYPLIPRAKFTVPYPGTKLAEPYKARHPTMTDEELLIRIAEVTNGPEDNVVFDLSDVPVQILIEIMAEFRRLERERAVARAR